MKLIPLFLACLTIVGSAARGELARVTPVDNETITEPKASLLTSDGADDIPMIINATLWSAEENATRDNASTTVTLNFLNVTIEKGHHNGLEGLLNESIRHPEPNEMLGEGEDAGMDRLCIDCDEEPTQPTDESDSHVENGSASTFPSDAARRRFANNTARTASKLVRADAAAGVNGAAPVVYGGSTWLNLILVVIGCGVVPFIMLVYVYHRYARVRLLLHGTNRSSVVDEYINDGFSNNTEMSMEQQPSFKNSPPAESSESRPHMISTTNLPPAKLSPFVLSLEMASYGLMMVTAVLYVLFILGAFKNQLTGRIVFTTGMIGTLFSTGLFSVVYFLAIFLDLQEPSYKPGHIPRNHLYLGFRNLHPLLIAMICLIPPVLAYFVAQPFVLSVFTHPMLEGVSLSSVWLLPLPWKVIKSADANGHAAVFNLLVVLMIIYFCAVLTAQLTAVMVLCLSMYFSDVEFIKTTQSEIRNPVVRQTFFSMAVTVFHGVTLAAFTMYAKAKEDAPQSLSFINSLLKFTFSSTAGLVLILSIVLYCISTPATTRDSRSVEESLRTGKRWQGPRRRNNSVGPPSSSKRDDRLAFRPGEFPVGVGSVPAAAAPVAGGHNPSAGMRLDAHSTLSSSPGSPLRGDGELSDFAAASSAASASFNTSVQQGAERVKQKIIDAKRDRAAVAVEQCENNSKTFMDRCGHFINKIKNEAKLREDVEAGCEALRSAVENDLDGLATTARRAVSTEMNDMRDPQLVAERSELYTRITKATSTGRRELSTNLALIKKDALVALERRLEMAQTARDAPKQPAAPAQQPSAAAQGQPKGAAKNKSEKQKKAADEKPKEEPKIGFDGSSQAEIERVERAEHGLSATSSSSDLKAPEGPLDVRSKQMDLVHSYDLKIENAEKSRFQGFLLKENATTKKIKACRTLLDMGALLAHIKSDLMKEAEEFRDRTSAEIEKFLGKEVNEELIKEKERLLERLKKYVSDGEQEADKIIDDLRKKAIEKVQENYQDDQQRQKALRADLEVLQRATAKFEQQAETMHKRALGEELSIIRRLHLPQKPMEAFIRKERAHLLRIFTDCQKERNAVVERLEDANSGDRKKAIDRMAAACDEVMGAVSEAQKAFEFAEAKINQYRQEHKNAISDHKELLSASKQVTAMLKKYEAFFKAHMEDSLVEMVKKERDLESFQESFTATVNSEFHKNSNQIDSIVAQHESIAERNRENHIFKPIFDKEVQFAKSAKPWIATRMEAFLATWECVVIFERVRRLIKTLGEPIKFISDQDLQATLNQKKARIDSAKQMMADLDHKIEVFNKKVMMPELGWGGLEIVRILDELAGRENHEGLRTALARLEKN